MILGMLSALLFGQLLGTRFGFGNVFVFVEGMWLTLEDAGESERLDRCLRMIWEIEIEWLMIWGRLDSRVFPLFITGVCGGIKAWQDREIGVVIDGRIMKWYLCFTYTLVSVMSFLF